MPVELDADIETVPGAPVVADGWRGLVDFGEIWTTAEANLWPAESGELPVGRPLTYGCEAYREQAAGSKRIRLVLFFLDEPRPVMTPGASIILRNGTHSRAIGHLR